jgi:uncharacterized BrkB/YihY/UPF0761 family membrane protein
LRALGFLLLQHGFELYLSSFPSYAAVYGAFATLPVFLLWLYLSWAVVLLGALVAATLPRVQGDWKSSCTPLKITNFPGTPDHESHDRFLCSRQVGRGDS